MNIKESGLIVFMERFEEGLAFYTSKLGLPLRQRKADLAILDFGGSYLMLEDRGVASDREKTKAQNPVIIRLDVDPFEQAVEEIRDRGVDVTVRVFDWGTIGVIVDPEGNRIELKKALA
ncbi:VOC family protein [Paenibacillus thalictri]|nr:VOC family protein [Paenibacillus thalictri]